MSYFESTNTPTVQLAQRIAPPVKGMFGSSTIVLAKPGVKNLLIYCAVNLTWAMAWSKSGANLPIQRKHTDLRVINFHPSKKETMLKRLFSIGLVVLLFHAGNSLLIHDVAQANQSDAASDKVKAAVAKRGTGPKAKVTVKLKDNSKLKGYISNAAGDSFTLSDSKTGQVRTLAYSDVAEVKKQGGMSLAAKIGIGVGAGVGALGLLYLIGCHDDPFC